MTFRVGLLGAGRMGRKHLEVLAELPAYSVVAVCDREPERLRSLPASLAPQAQHYADCGAMLSETALDLLVIATPPVVRLEPAVDALGRGVAVLCEKPFADNLEVADRLVEASERSGVPLAVHHQWRVNAVLSRTRDMINAGAIGDVTSVRGLGKGGRRGGVELLELGVHLADAMGFLFGPAEWCAARIWETTRLANSGDVSSTRAVAPEETELGLVVGTRVEANYGFSGGVSGELRFEGHAERTLDNYGLDIFGTRGQLALRLSRFVDPPLWHLPRPASGSPGQWGDWRPVPGLDGANRGLVREYHCALLPVIERKMEPPCGAREGRQALEMVLAPFRSHRAASSRVPLPAPARSHPLSGWVEPDGSD